MDRVMRSKTREATDDLEFTRAWLEPADDDKATFDNDPSSHGRHHPLALLLPVIAIISIWLGLSGAAHQFLTGLKQDFEIARPTIGTLVK
jgi:hypothetical protein